MKRLLGTLAVILCSLTMLAEGYLSIFRSDGKFNQAVMADGFSLSHTPQGGGFAVSLMDRIAGNSLIDIAAIDSCVIRRTDIPVLRFSLPDYPTAHELWDKDLYVNAELSVEGGGLVPSAANLSLQIKGRGNSSWGMPKKPMRLKFEKKTELCGLRKAKNFVLLSNYLDPTLMRNALALWLARRLDVPAANTIVPCHLFINDSYAGAYTLTEKVGINSASVDIDENQGVLLELSVEYDEPYKFRSRIWQLPVMIKDPDLDKLLGDTTSTTQHARLQAWQSDFNRAETLAAQGRGAEAFDIESAVNYYLVYNIAGNDEIGYPKSFYIHKRALGDSEKYFFGPVWDFDVAFNFTLLSDNNPKECEPNGNLWIPALLNAIIKTPEFKARYAERLEEVKQTILPELLEFFDSYAVLIEPSAKLNGLRWSYTGPYSSWAYVYPSFDTRVHTAALRQWLIDRIAQL